MMDLKKPYLVDVPVAIQAFVRPEMLKKQWEVIKIARPSTLIIRSDGPRKTVSSDKQKIDQSRKICEDVDWDCDVHRLYFSENQGMYKMIELGDDYIWKRFDRCIFLEDDQIPSISFFRYCADLLEKYKDDQRIFCIHGVNLCGVWEYSSSDYFFARVPASSGVALWRRSYDFNSICLKYKDDPYLCRIINKTLPWYLKKQFKSFAKKGVYANHKPASEFLARYAQVCQNQLIIVPKKNLINNIGVGEGSTHTANSIRTLPKGLQKLYDMETYELSFPLIDPECVIPDVFFEKEREKQLGVSSKIRLIYRSCSRVIRLIVNGEIKRLVNGIKKRTLRSVEK